MSQPAPASGRKPSGRLPHAGRQFNVWKFLGVFIFIFLALVGGWFWFFWGRVQAAQAYAQQTLAAAEHMDVAAGALLSCSEITGQPMPSGVESCVYHATTGPRNAAGSASPAEVELTLQGGRRVRISASYTP